MNFHPPIRLARSEEFLALGCVERLLLRALWTRGEARRWTPDGRTSAAERIYRELEAIGLLVGPGARDVFDLALASFLATGAMRREGDELVLPVLSGDVAREQPSAATLRKREQRRRDRERAARGEVDGDPEARDPGRDMRGMSRGTVTGGGRDPGRDESRDSGRDVTLSGASPEREEKRVFSSSLSGNSDPSGDDARASTGGAPVTPGVTPQVTLSTLTEADVVGLLEREAGGRIGLHPRSLRPRLLERLAEESVTLEQLAVLARLARERALYLQDKHAVVDLALLVGARDGEAKVLGSWINATHRAIALERTEAEREAQRQRDLAPRPAISLPGTVKIPGPPPLRQVASGGARIGYLDERRAGPRRSDDGARPPSELPPEDAPT